MLAYLKDIDTGVANSGHIEILKDTRVVSAAGICSFHWVQLTLSVYAHEIQRQRCACDNILNTSVGAALFRKAVRSWLVPWTRVESRAAM